MKCSSNLGGDAYIRPLLKGFVISIITQMNIRILLIYYSRISELITRIINIITNFEK